MERKGQLTELHYQQKIINHMSGINWNVKIHHFNHYCSIKKPFLNYTPSNRAKAILYKYWCLFF